MKTNLLQNLPGSVIEQIYIKIFLLGVLFKKRNKVYLTHLSPKEAGKENMKYK